MSADRAVAAALKAGDDAHLLTIGSPTRGLALRVARGRLSRRGIWRPWMLNVFVIRNGRRVGP